MDVAQPWTYIGKIRIGTCGPCNITLYSNIGRFKCKIDVQVSIRSSYTIEGAFAVVIILQQPVAR